MYKKKLAVLILIAFTVLSLIPYVQATAYYVDITGYDTTEGTDVAVEIFVNSVSQGNTPLSVIGVSTDDVITAAATDTYSNPLRGFEVNGYLYIGSSLTLTAEITSSWLPSEYGVGATITVKYESYSPPSPTPTPTPAPTPEPGATPTPTPAPTPVPASPISGNYTIIGCNDELDGTKTPNPVQVIAYYSNGRVPETFWVNGTYYYPTNYSPLYLRYLLAEGVERQYWVTLNQASGTFYIFNQTLTTYTINFMDQTGILKSNPYINIQRYINGTLTTVERLKVDSQGTINAHLMAGRKYYLTLEGESTYSYGEVLFSSTTNIQLVLRGVDFPKETLLLYQYVHAYAIRDFLTPTGAITVSYEDTTSRTNEVIVTITNASSGVIAFTQTFLYNNSFAYTWTNADNATDYQVRVNVNHQTYGVFHYDQILRHEGIASAEPFSLSFLGSAGISSAVIIPALLIIFVAGCFSEFSSEAAAIVTIIVAILLTALGWIDLSQGVIISALALAVMAGIVTARRRMMYQ
jgi:hypothetical protein